MRQENGRVRPASKEETANFKAKGLKCLGCGNTITAKITFGEVAICNICGADMVQDKN